jgi:alpha-mannosidase
VSFQEQQIFKDAPFDITASRLTNTFFDSWFEIKNNVILHWVDVYDPSNHLGLALMTDHTTSYAHSSDFPLALTLQYAGVGLWGRDYTVQGPTEVSYSLLPHHGNYEQANIWTAGNSWDEPLVAHLLDPVPKTGATRFSLLAIENSRWEVTTMRGGSDNVLIRLFNPSSDETPKAVRYRGAASKVELIQLNGEAARELPVRNRGVDGITFELALPKFAVRTLRITM